MNIACNFSLFILFAFILLPLSRQIYFLCKYFSKTENSEISMFFRLKTTLDFDDELETEIYWAGCGISAYKNPAQRIFLAFF